MRTWSVRLVLMTTFGFCGFLGFQNCSQMQSMYELNQSSIQSIGFENVLPLEDRTFNPISSKFFKVLYSDDQVISATSKKYSQKISSKVMSKSSTFIDREENILYFIKHPNIPWTSDVQYRSILQRLFAACDKWKSVANVDCFEISSLSELPEGKIPVFVGIAQVQLVDQNQNPIFKEDGTPASLCGWKYDVRKKDGQIQRGRYSTVSCATIGTVWDEDSMNGMRFVAVNERHGANTVLHEVGHLFGLPHTHQRPDRDNYLVINPGLASDFAGLSNYLIVNEFPGMNQPFDFGSAMTYYYDHLKSPNFKEINQNILELRKLLDQGAGFEGHSNFQSVANYNSKIAAGAVVYRSELFYANQLVNARPISYDSSKGVDQAFPSPIDAAVMSEIFGPPASIQASCVYGSISIPHGTQIAGADPRNTISCNPYQMACINGQLSNSTFLRECPARCQIAGQAVKEWEEIRFFSSASVLAGQNCEVKNKLCTWRDFAEVTPGSTTCSTAEVPRCNYTYEANFGTCQPNGKKYRAVASKTPTPCSGDPVIPEEACSNSPPPAPIPSAGYFKINNAIYYLNGLDAYCLYSNWEKFSEFSGITDVSTIRNFTELPAVRNDGFCNIPVCSYTYTEWSACKKLSATSAEQTRTVLSKIPIQCASDKTLRQACNYQPELSEGLFKIGTTIYYSNGIGHYCMYDNWEKFKLATGIDDISTIRSVSAIPNSMVHDGVCIVP